MKCPDLLTRLTAVENSGFEIKKPKRYDKKLTTGGIPPQGHAVLCKQTDCRLFIINSFCVELKVVFKLGWLLMMETGLKSNYCEKKKCSHVKTT